jgi:hypothetical protein
LGDSEENLNPVTYKIAEHYRLTSSVLFIKPFKWSDVKKRLQNISAQLGGNNGSASHLIQSKPSHTLLESEYIGKI